MLIKRIASMISSSVNVKTLSRTAVMALTFGAMTAAGSASAFSSNMTERVITVKIKMSELKAPDGIKKTYMKLKSEAESYCEADDATLYVTGETVSECTSELLTQFVESTGIESLEDYHLAQPI